MKSPQPIEQLASRIRFKPDPSVDERILAAAEAALRQRTAPEVQAERMWKVIMRNPITKLAIAAAIIAAGLLLTIRWRGDQEALRQGPDPIVERDEPKETQITPILKEDTERNEAQQLYAQGDLRGLLRLLESGQEQTKVQIAKYLAEIGDASALAALQTLAEKWQGEVDENPFAIAIGAIRTRIEPPDANDDPVTPQASTGRSWQFRPRGVLSGIVTDAITGRPVTDMRIEISRQRIYDTETDAHGFYCFQEIERDGNYRIRVNSQAYLDLAPWNEQPAVSLTRANHAVRHLRLQPGCKIDVDVVDERGQAIPEVDLFVTCPSKERNWSVIEDTKTDAHGHAVLGAIAPADEPYLITAQHDGYALGHARITLNDTKVTVYQEMVLRQGQAVHGFVQYSDGVAATDVKVYAKPDWWHLNRWSRRFPVNADGTFALEHILPGTYSVYVYTEKKGGGGSGRSIRQIELPLAEGEPLHLRIPQESPQSLAIVSGQIHWLNNKQPRRLTISASSPTGSRERIDIWKDLNTFEIGSLEPGTYSLRFSGENVREKMIENVQAPSSSLEIELEYAEKPRLRGTVVAAASLDTIKAFRARVIKVGSLRGGYVPGSEWYHSSDGTFDVEAVGPGIYQVQVVAQGYAPGLSPKINTDDNQDVLVELTPGGSIKGYVMDHTGKLLSGATVIPLSSACGNMPSELQSFVSQEGGVSTSDGLFVLEHMPPGTETLKVIHPDYSYKIVRDIAVFEGDATEGIDVVLSNGGTVQGYVYDPQQRPQANVTLFLQDDTSYYQLPDDETHRLAVATTDANGFYQAMGLPTDKICYVHRKNAGKQLGVVRRVCLPMEGKKTTLDFGGEPVIRGTIVVDGRPQANVPVQLADPENAHFGGFVCEGVTTADGGFSFGGIPAGVYGIYYQGPESRRDWFKLKTLTVHQEDLDLGVIPEQFCGVELLIDCPDHSFNRASWQVFLQPSNTSRPSRMGHVSVPELAGAPYRIEHLLPGEYQVMAQRNENGLTFSTRIKLESERQKATLSIPPCTASIQGQVLSSTDQGILDVWTKDEKIRARIRFEQGAYTLGDLPAGHYCAGSFNLKGQTPVAEFDLQEGQSKRVDIDISEWSSGQSLGILVVQVVGHNGFPLGHTEAWLEGPSGRIDSMSKSSLLMMFVTKPGPYELVVQGRGHETHIESIQLDPIDPQSPSGPRQTITVKLNRP